MHSILQQFLDFLFPLSCISCGARDTLLCSSCAESAVTEKHAPESIIAFFSYRAASIRRGIWELKYRGKTAWADTFAEYVCEGLAEELSDRALFADFRKPLLVSVPLAPRRLRMRGYNQSALITRAIARRDPEIYTLAENALVRVRETESQMEIKDKKKRHANVLGAFLVSRPEEIAGKNIIVLDDVATTGATLAACRDALLDAGARAVLLVSIAH